MELAEAVHRRRMVRRFDPDRPVPAEVLDRILRLALRAPSAGFSQGSDFVVLEDRVDVDAYWSLTTQAAGHGDGDSDSDDPVAARRRRWRSGVRNAPVLVICSSDREAYLRRYAEPDKGGLGSLHPGGDDARWPVPYWDVDTGMAAMLMLLGAVDEGLGGLFFGVPPEHSRAVHDLLEIPQDRGLVGVVALGYGLPTPGAGRRRRRRPMDEVIHRRRFHPSQDHSFS